MTALWLIVFVTFTPVKVPARARTTIGVLGSTGAVPAGVIVADGDGAPAGVTPGPPTVPAVVVTAPAAAPHAVNANPLITARTGRNNHRRGASAGQVPGMVFGLLRVGVASNFSGRAA